MTMNTATVTWWSGGRPTPRGSGEADAAATVCIHIDGRALEVPSGVSVLNAAINAGIYIPALCNNPYLPPAQQCCRSGHDGSRAG